MIIYFDFKSRNYSIESSRSGHSKLTTWRPLDHGTYLKNVSFGVVNHPFNPGEISFRRKTFTPYKPTDMGGKDYGIAIKGTAIHEDEYNNLVVDTNPMPMTIRKLFHKYGEKFYQSYPSLVKSFKKQDKMSNATMSPSLTGTRSIQATRKFPSVVINATGNQEIPHETGNHVFFVPRPIYAMHITPYSSHNGILFDKKQSAKSWVEWHNQLDYGWQGIIRERHVAA
jgi:hypothetical protein